MIIKVFLYMNLYEKVLNEKINIFNISKYKKLIYFYKKKIKENY